MEYYILTKNKFKNYGEELKEYMINDLNLNIKLITKEEDLDYAKEVVKISKEIVTSSKKEISAIFIDETGGLGFMASAKVKGMICAQISDEHSSHMTREHNGAIGISLGANISSIHQIKLITKLFVENNFAAGRHMVRIDMLNKMA